MREKTEIKTIAIKSAEAAAQYLGEQIFIRRRIYPLNVQALLKDLKEDLTFLQPLTFGEKNGKLYVIDGQHRMMAIQRYFEDGGLKEIRIMVNIESNLSMEKMQKIYGKIATQRVQNTKDKILIGTEGAEIYKLLTERLQNETGIIITPHTASKKKHEILYSNLMLAYYRASNGLDVEIHDYTPAFMQMTNYNEADYNKIKFALMQYKHTHIDAESGIMKHHRFFTTVYLQIYLYLWMFLRKNKLSTEILTDAEFNFVKHPQIFWKMDGEFKQLRGGKSQTRVFYNLIASRINRVLKATKETIRVPLYKGVGDDEQ